MDKIKNRDSNCLSDGKNKTDIIGITLRSIYGI